MQKPIAIFPGTFDPPHLGHIDVLEKAVNTFGLVYWAILRNSKKLPKIDESRRLKMMAETSVWMKRVEVVSYSGFLVDAANHFGATHIVRSLRVGMDFDYEFPMTLVNRKLAPELITVYFPAEQHHFHISSTLVRELIEGKKDVSEYVPPAVLALL